MSEQDPPPPDVAAHRARPAHRRRQHYPGHAAARNARNWMMVWYRNYMVWKKLAIPSMIGNLRRADDLPVRPRPGAEPAGWGEVHGVSYIALPGGGHPASSVMMSASFESMYSAFSRMHVQRTWEAIMHAAADAGRRGAG